MFRLIAIVLAVSFANSTQAQTPPSAVQINQYESLHKAAHEGNVALIRQLVGSGADVNAVDSSGRTPALVAAFASNDDALRALAEAGVDMNAFEYGIYDVVTIAAVANDPEMVALAIELGNRADNITSIYVGTALIAAAHLGHHEVVEILIDGGAPLDHINILHWTALIESVILGDGGPDHVATAKTLVKAGADVSIGDKNGVTALDHAISLGYTEMVQVIDSDG
jgi:ankyrin repeat protein